MSASDARPIPRKNTAFRVYFPILDADGDLVTGASSLDSEVSLDGASFADCTSEATEIGSTGNYYLDLTASEMNADAVVVQVKTATSGAKTTVIVMYPEEAGDIRADVVQISGDSAAADNLEAAADGTGYNLGGGSVVAASVTGAVGSVTGNVGGSVASVTADPSGVTTLLSRLSSARAGYLDNLSAGAVALASALTSAAADITTLLSRLTSTRAGYLDNLSSAPPSAATIADAVLDELLSGHAIAGSAGAALSAAGSATDPMTNQATGYASGTLGYILSRLSMARVVLQSLVTSTGDIPEIVGGADYNATDGTAFTWTNSGGSWPTLTGATVTWKAEAPNGQTASYSVTVTDGVGDDKAIQMELTTTQSAALTTAYVGAWTFAVWATLSSGRKTRLVRGRAGVVDGPGPE